MIYACRASALAAIIAIASRITTQTRFDDGKGSKLEPCLSIHKLKLSNTSTQSCVLSYNTNNKTNEVRTTISYSL